MKIQDVDKSYMYNKKVCRSLFVCLLSVCVCVYVCVCVGGMEGTLINKSLDYKKHRGARI